MRKYNDKQNSRRKKRERGDHLKGELIKNNEGEVHRWHL